MKNTVQGFDFWVSQTLVRYLWNFWLTCQIVHQFRQRMSTYTDRRPFSLCVFEDCGSELLIKLLHFVGRQYFVRFAEAVAFVWRNTLVAVGSQWCVVGQPAA